MTPGERCGKEFVALRAAHCSRLVRNLSEPKELEGLCGNARQWVARNALISTGYGARLAVRAEKTRITAGDVGLQPAIAQHLIEYRRQPVCPGDLAVGLRDQIVA